MKLTMLGTGNAMVTNCYNTCFAFEEDGRCFLVDAGGGSTILRRLREAGIDWKRRRGISLGRISISITFSVLSG